MKTGFLYGDARTPKFVYYYYHGKIMQCRKEPRIPPYIYYDTHPAEYPPNFYYECDTMPNGATPPMTFHSSRGTTVTIAGGLFEAHTCNCPGYGQSYVRYYWPIHPTYKLEITALFPTLQIDDPNPGYTDAAVQTSTANGPGVKSRRIYRTSGGHNYIYDEYTQIQTSEWVFYRRPFTNYMHIIIEKILGTNKWNFYFNDELISYITNPYLWRINFTLAGLPAPGGLETMDYIRAWVDKERT